MPGVKKNQSLGILFAVVYIAALFYDQRVGLIVLLLALAAVGLYAIAKRRFSVRVGRNHKHYHDEVAVSIGLVLAAVGIFMSVSIARKVWPLAFSFLR